MLEIARVRIWVLGSFMVCVWAVGVGNRFQATMDLVLLWWERAWADVTLETRACIVAIDYSPDENAFAVGVLQSKLKKLALSGRDNFGPVSYRFKMMPFWVLHWCYIAFRMPIEFLNEFYEFGTFMKTSKITGRCSKSYCPCSGLEIILINIFQARHMALYLAQEISDMITQPGCLKSVHTLLSQCYECVFAYLSGWSSCLSSGDLVACRWPRFKYRRWHRLSSTGAIMVRERRVCHECAIRRGPRY